MTTEQINMFFCEYCKTEFKTKLILNHHQNTAKYCLIIQGKVQKEDFKCELCNKNISSKQKLENHKKICSKEYKCDLCNRILSSKQKLENHKSICVKKKEFNKIKKELESKIKMIMND